MELFIMTSDPMEVIFYGLLFLAVGHSDQKSRSLRRKLMPELHFWAKP